MSTEPEIFHVPFQILLAHPLLFPPSFTKLSIKRENNFLRIQLESFQNWVFRYVESDLKLLLYNVT